MCGRTGAIGSRRSRQSLRPRHAARAALAPPRAAAMAAERSRRAGPPPPSSVGGDRLSGRRRRPLQAEEHEVKIRVRARRRTAVSAYLACARASPLRKRGTGAGPGSCHAAPYRTLLILWSGACLAPMRGGLRIRVAQAIPAGEGPHWQPTWGEEHFHAAGDFASRPPPFPTSDCTPPPSLAAAVEAPMSATVRPCARRSALSGVRVLQASANRRTRAACRPTCTSAKPGTSKRSDRIGPGRPQRPVPALRTTLRERGCASDAKSPRLRRPWEPSRTFWAFTAVTAGSLSFSEAHASAAETAGPMGSGASGIG